MARKLLTEEIYQKMYKDYKTGLSSGDIAHKYGFNVKTVLIHFYKHNVYFSNQQRFSKHELESIVSDYRNGMRPYELAQKYNRHSGTIIGKLKDLGLYKDVNHHFSQEEIDFLKVHYPTGDWDAISRFIPGVSKQSIHTKMHKLGIKANSYFWEDEDIEILKQNYENLYGKVNSLVGLFDGRYTYKAICTKAKKLGLKTRDAWSAKEIKIMMDNYSKKTLDEMIALLPKRSRHSIIGKAIKLGLKNCCKYQEWETKFIIDNWTSMSDQEIANHLSKTFRGVKAKRESLGLFRVKEKSCYADICDFLRKNNSFWKEDSMKECNYKCVLTGKRFDDIHHIYSFNLIVGEVIEALDIDIEKLIDEFEKEELRDILDTFRAIQDTYPLDVCLCKEIHTLFHNIYGYGDTTEDNWNEFVLNYKNNKYNHLLDVA